MAYRLSMRRGNLTTLYIALSAPAIGLLAVKLMHNLYSVYTTDGVPKRPPVLRAPSTTALTAEEYNQIPYPPDALPGGRNISTPYGNLRVYEWGPEDGRKVLFVHGISTPCIALSRLASRLVKRGCRVMLFDLPGRGYSDCPDTNHYHQDITLFSTCILSVLSSSRLPWMTERFTLAGYSLGGGISAAFTANYPDLVESLVLIAPGGLLRPTRLSLSSKILYSGLLPDSIVNYFVGRRLRVSAPKPKPAVKPLPRVQDLKKFDWTQVPHSTRRRISVTAAMHAETSCDTDDEDDDDDGEIDPHAPGQDSLSPIFDDRPNISPATAVAWQVEAHPGFIPAFVSSIRFAPIHDAYAYWNVIGQRCATARAHQVRQHSDASDASGRKHSMAGSEDSASSTSSSASEPRATGLDEGKVLLLLGKKDVIIMPDETIEDATAALGKENVTIVKINGGHDLVLSNVEGCANAMTEFWV